jgi:hypothetical protein
MSDDFIEKLRQEAGEKKKQPKSPEPWEIERQKAQKEQEQRKRNRILAMQYFQESGCQAYCEKLAAFLNDQNPDAKASFSEGYNYSWSIAYQINFDFYIKDSYPGAGLQKRRVWFNINVNPDWSLFFQHMSTGSGGEQTPSETVTFNEWRTNKQAVDKAFERAYRSAADYQFKHRLSD